MYKGLDKLQPQFRAKVELWLKDNPEIFVTETWRSQQRQQELYAQGRTKPGPIVTWTLDSEHTKGLAVDVAFYGKELYPKNSKKREKIAKSAKYYGIDWGYSLWQKDKPHFQDNGQPLTQQNIMDYLALLMETLEKEKKTLADTIFEQYEGESTMKERDVKALISIGFLRQEKRMVEVIQKALKGLEFVGKIS